MTSLGVEWGAKYTLTAADGTVVVFNDSTDPNFIGILSPESSGLDSADVREDATDAIEEDGGHHGDFYEGRRPVVLQGTIIASSATQRNERVGKLKLVSRALRKDATLKWTPLGGAAVELKLRRQQPLRITKGFVKEFQLPMVAADIFPKSVTVHEAEIKGKEATVSKFPAAGESLGGSGLDWVSPNNIITSNNVSASTTLSTSASTDPLLAKGFDFSSIPKGAAFTKIKVGIEAHVEGLEGYTVKIDSGMLYKKGAKIGNDLGTIAGIEFALPGDLTEFISGTIDEWGINPTLEELNEIGAAVTAKRKTEKSGPFFIDSMKIDISYITSASTEVENTGDANSLPIIKAYGGTSIIELINETTNERIVIEDITLKESEYMEVDFRAHTIKRNGTEYAYNTLNFESSSWWGLKPGKSKIAALATKAVIKWQDAYL